MSSKDKPIQRQITLYMREDLIERISDCIETLQVKISRTQFITWATVEHLKRIENYGTEETTDLSQ